jgi:regulator of PEP synthase PpsR (kinase-PPPase family)
MLTIFIVSDAAGETAERMVRSAALLYAIEMNRLILYNFLAIPVQRVSG